MPKISTYPSMVTLTGPELLLGDQAGQTATATALQVASFALGQIKSGDLVSKYAGTDSGAANAYVVTLGAPTPTLVPGQIIIFTPNNNNTGPATISVNGLGALPAFGWNGGAMLGGELSQTGPALMQYTGTGWQLMATVGAQNGYQRTLVETAQGIIPSSYTYLPYTALRYMTPPQIASVLGFKMPSAGGLDVTAALNLLFSITQGNGGVIAELPYGVYCAQGIVNIANGGLYKCNQSLIVCAAVAPIDCLVKYTAAYGTVKDMYLYSEWNPFCHDALHWTSRGALFPSQSNNFDNLRIQNFLSDICFGDWGGGVNEDQSENYIRGFHTRGSQNIIHSNQPEGFLKIEGEVASSKNEWDTNNPNFGAIATLGTLVGGAAYTDGTYSDVLLVGGSGTGAYAQIVVVGGAVAFVTLMHAGVGFTAGNILFASAASIGGTGAGFTITVATVGGFNYGVAGCVQNCQGNIAIAVADTEKTDSPLGIGIWHPDINGLATTVLSAGDAEIACTNVELASGNFAWHGQGGEYWSSGSTPFIQLTGGGSGKIQINGFTLNKDPAQSGANQGFLDCGGTTGNWRISFTDLDLENQFQLLYWNNNTSKNSWLGNIDLHMQNVGSFNAAGGSTPPVYKQVSTSTYNLLDATGTDVNGNDIGTWYKIDSTGTGAIAVNADVPAGSTYSNSYQITPAASGTSIVTSIDVSSLANCKKTSFKVKPGDVLLLEGWWRMVTAGQGNATLIFANASGVNFAEGDIATDSSSPALTAAWQYISGFVIVPATACYAGVGIRGAAGTVCRLVGTKVTRPS